MCLESEHGYLGVLAFLTLCPLPTCSPSATFSRFPTAISVHTRASFPRLDPTPPLAFRGTVPVPLPPFQYSAGSVEGPHTDLEEAGPRIRSPGTGADGTQPRGQRAGTRTGAHICARADHVNAAAQAFHRPTPRLLASRFQLPTTSLQQVPSHLPGPFCPFLLVKKLIKEGILMKITELFFFFFLMSWVVQRRSLDNVALKFHRNNVDPPDKIV